MPASMAAEGAEWGVRFPFADGAVRDRIELQLRPGETGHDAIQLVNRSETTLSFEIATADAEYSADGVTSALPGEVSAAGLWVAAATSRLQLAPHSERSLEFSVAVPANAEAGRAAAALTVSQLAEHASAGQIPVERTLAVIVHIEVAAEPQLAITETPDAAVGGWALPLVIVVVVILVVLMVCVLLLLSRRQRRSQT